MTDRPFETLYPDYDVLAKWDSPSWNRQTRQVVHDRLHHVPPRRFLTETQWATLGAICDCVIPQPERDSREKVPIAPWIDAKLEANQSSGTRYEPLPPMRECWQRGLDAVNSEAQQRFHAPFAALDPARWHMIVEAMDGAATTSPAWGPEFPARLFLRHVLLPGIVEIYYAHPASWSEIGFGGPASPRGYVRLTENRRDSWEGEEHPTAMLAAVLRP